MHMALDLAVLEEARRRALEALPKGESMVHAATPEETQTYVNSNGFSRRNFLERAAKLGGIGLIGGLGAVLQACGGGVGLDRRVSLAGVDAEFQEFVNVVIEYAVYRATGKRKPGRKPGEIGDMLRNYIIRQNKRPITEDYLGELNTEIANFKQLNKYLIKGNVFLTFESFEGTPIINIYEIDRLEKPDIYSNGKHIGPVKVAYLGKKLFSTNWNRLDHNGNYILGKIEFGKPLENAKNLVVFIHYLDSMRRYGRGKGLENLLKFKLYHELGHSIENYSIDPQGEYSADLHGLKAGKTFEGVNNAWDIVRYLREAEKKEKLEGDMEPTINFVSATDGLKDYQHEISVGNLTVNLQSLGNKVHQISQEERKLNQRLTVYPTDPRKASPLQIWLMSDAFSKVPMDRAYEVIGK